jgi:hypothetical protein
MTKKKKIILSISSVLLVLILYGWFFGVRTFYVVGARCFLRQPALSIVPVPMDVKSSSEPVMVLNAYDVSFSVPWAELAESGSFTSMVWWTTSSSNISIICFAPEEGLYSSMLTLGESGEDLPGSQTFLSEVDLGDVSDTNYYLCSRMWNTTPEDISFFDPLSELATDSMFLLLKGIGAPTGFSEMNSFQAGCVKGVQFADFSENGYVQLTLFDSLDREVRLIVRSFTNSMVITQSDINTIITTFSVNP